MLYEKIIKGESVYLKSAQMEDLEFTYEIRQDRERTKYMHAIKGIEEQKKWLQQQIEMPGDYFFIVYDNADNRIGTCSIYDVDFFNMEAEIGRNLLNGNPTQNFEALVLIHEFAFCDLKLKKLNVGILSENKTSIGVTTRMGGKEVYRQYDDEFKMDMVHYVIWKEDYEEKRDKLLSIINRFAKRV